MLCPTPPEKLCDARGRPYFLWDNELTLAEFLALLRGSAIRALSPELVDFTQGLVTRLLRA